MATIYGTDFNDNNTYQQFLRYYLFFGQVNGTNDPDLIYALNGNDTLQAGSDFDVSAGIILI